MDGHLACFQVHSHVELEHLCDSPVDVHPGLLQRRHAVLWYSYLQPSAMFTWNVTS